MRRASVWGFIRQPGQDAIRKMKNRNTFTELRKEDSPVKSSMECVATDLSVGLLSELECPVCMEYMLPPITFCLNGHNICNTCKPQLSNCPTCRQPFVDIRNVALEKLARQMKYPCTNRKYGCKDTFLPSQVAMHQAICRHSPQICPLEKLRKVKCDWMGSGNEVKKHLKKDHKEQCLEYNGIHTLILCGIKDSCGYFRIIFAHNEIFYRHFQIKEGSLFATLQYIGPTANASRYRYKVTFINKSNTECITFSQVARNFSESLDDIFDAGNCVKLHLDVVHRFVNDKNDLIICMEIFRVNP